MILRPQCEESFMVLVHKTFILSILQMLSLFTYKLGIACLVLTSLVLLCTMVFVLIEQNNQQPICTRALLEHLESNPDSEGDIVEDTLAE